MPKFILLKILSTLSTLLLLASCVTPSVETNVLMPAKQNGMVNVKRIGVETLKGDRNEIMSSRLKSFIAGIQVGGKPYFTLVDLDRQSVFKEQKLSDSAWFSSDTSANLGNLKAADTIFGGSFDFDFNSTMTHKDKVYCASKSDDGCIRYSTKKVACHQRVSSAELSLRATDVELGTISFTKTYRDSSKYAWCDDMPLLLVLAPKDRVGMKEENIKEILKELRNDIAPYVITYNIKYMRKDKTKFGGFEEVRSLFKSGLKFVENERPDRGCELFREAASIFNKSPAIYHNLGACAESEGDFDSALAFYNKADRLTLSPNRLISEALLRVKKTIKGRTILNDQLR